VEARTLSAVQFAHAVGTTPHRTTPMTAATAAPTSQPGTVAPKRPSDHTSNRTTIATRLSRCSAWVVSSRASW